MINRSNALWFKDAIIYEAHVKAFCDSNGDGMGDFAGFTSKLDYLQELGVNALWLLPFYPSPQRDDGYDIARYMAVNTDYGSTHDFRKLLRECHERDIRVITELVMNHTSDQHAWFQRARRAKPGSAARNFYVWSDDPARYGDARIIFLDVEKSNWTWDAEAGAYFWHRFYSHQPDLNYNNPRVLEEMLKVMNFWLDMGVDGLRLDAIPYLIEREGTNCENLPETHAIIRRIRAEIDAKYPDRTLIAEANQWPEDVAPYFGEGDECHMCYHFPLMPRIYMAIAQEDRHPITDIMRQTPDIPSNCQWAMFLRNHDELTLEMVTEKERDYLWSLYAVDPRMRLNLGIRRRLAPLLGNDRAKIELLNSLLLSMPGTPIIYYGDEIGMGDNVYLGDRNGVRTPMQWSSDRNGGFSTADPERLFLPVIMDSVYGYQAVNVEAQRRSSSSLLNWMKRMLALRKQSRALSSGTQTFLYPKNRKILAYLRECEGESILCVANLSRSAQAVELDLSPVKGRAPVEMLGRANFPPIGDLPYLLTLPSYGFFWFSLAPVSADAPVEIAEAPPEFFTLVLRENWRSLVSGREGELLRARILPYFISKQRWFAGKDDQVVDVIYRVCGAIEAGDSIYVFMHLDVELASGVTHRYFFPLGVSRESDEEALKLPPAQILAKVRRAARMGLLHDATDSSGFLRAVIDGMSKALILTDAGDTLQFNATSRLANLKIDDGAPVERLGHEQSNTSIRIGEAAILKVFRKLMPGINPEIEVSRFLTETERFSNTPALLGHLEYRRSGQEAETFAVLYNFVSNQGDGWRFTREYLHRYFDELRMLTEERPPAEEHARYLEHIRMLGRRTAELHQALAGETDDPVFKAEPITGADMTTWAGAARAQLEKAFVSLAGIGSKVDEAHRQAIGALLSRKDDSFEQIDALARECVHACKSRIHGDYHLGQVLVVKSDFWIVDFEGEPTRSLAERRAKLSPLRDIAGMLRSLDYAAASALIDYVEGTGESLDKLEPYALAWRDLAQRTFRACYEATIGETVTWPIDAVERERLLTLFTIEKSAYEISYEAANRPHWIRIPISGLSQSLDRLRALERISA